MKQMKKPQYAAMIVMALASIAVIGACDSNSNKAATGGDTTGKENSEAAKPAVKPLVPVPQMADWCREHGVPESACTRCNSDLIAGFKDKGDWCKGHEVPESQCFKCNPEKKEQFAAQYKAKYGKEPPATQPEM